MGTYCKKKMESKDQESLGYELTNFKSIKEVLKNKESSFKSDVGFDLLLTSKRDIEEGRKIKERNKE